MINAMLGFMKDVLKMKPQWVVFVHALLAVNMIGPLFFWSAPEAKVVFAVMVGNAILMVALHAKFGFVRLLSIGHFLWVPMVPWLWLRLDAAIPGSAFATWLFLVIVLDSLSLVIDFVDVMRYLSGEIEPILVLD